MEQFAVARELLDIDVPVPLHTALNDAPKAEKVADEARKKGQQKLEKEQKAESKKKK